MFNFKNMYLYHSVLNVSNIYIAIVIITQKIIQIHITLQCKFFRTIIV